MNPAAFSLLRILSDGEFHSGEAAAKMLGLSRASVCNAADAIEASGLDLFRVRGKGYRLPSKLEWLEAPEIPPFQVEIVDTIDSTNSELSRRNAPHGRVIAAEMQSAGRGRMGRSWHGAPCSSLTFSLCWRFEKGASHLSGLGPAVSLALARAMQSMGIEGIRIKWPNDLIHNFRKLSGILIEVKVDMLGPTHAVIGIGINLRLPAKTREDIDQAVTDLASIASCGRNELFRSVLAELSLLLPEFEREGFAPLSEEWNRLHAYHGKEVRLLHPSGRIEEGRVDGIGAGGELHVLTSQGRKIFSAGEISLRGKS